MITKRQDWTIFAIGYDYEYFINKNQRHYWHSTGSLSTKILARMDAQLRIFYDRLDRSKFKYFVRPDAFCVYGTDIAMLPPECQGRAKADACVRLPAIDAIVKDMLVRRRIPVEEYRDQTLLRSGQPYDYGDFMDVCLDDTIIPTLCAVARHTRSGAEAVEFAFVRDSKVHVTEFMDDDLFSNVFSLVSTQNCIEILHSDPAFVRIANGWGVSATLVAAADAAAMVSAYTRKDLPVERFEREDCCLVDARDFDLVDFGCVTRQGRRLLEQWLRSPLVSAESIAKRLDLAEAFAHARLPLNRMPDLKRIAGKILNRRITIQECIRMYQAIQEVPGLVGALRDCASAAQRERTEQHAKYIEEGFICPLENVYKIFGPYLREIEEKIDVGAGRIVAGLTERIASLEAQKQALQNEISREFAEVQRVFPRAKFQANAFKISRSEYNQGCFDEKNYVVLSILKTGVSFLTRTMAAHRERLEQVETQIANEEARVLDGIRDGMLVYVNSLEIYNYVLALADIYGAFSSKTRLPGYSRPVFTTGAYEVTGLFHPLLENKDCVLNDIGFGPCGDAKAGAQIESGSDARENKTNANNSRAGEGAARSLCVLTGPNMGGKSTLLKAMSTVSLYAQIGCYVPAKRARIPVFDRILMRVGARDHSSRGLSTFMVEMLDLNRILRTATPRSLILIDELGRGTSAIDGLSLVTAVKERLVSLGAKTVMATHFSELGDENTLNKKMLVRGSLLTYKVEDGVADSSFGICVAELASFPKEVIERAKEYLKENAGIKRN